ncbi:MAG: anthranilate phosphoribosyltransferase [Acidimicrobiales bacterium]
MTSPASAPTGAGAVGSIGSIGGWPAVLARLVAGRDLTAAEAEVAMADILAGQASPAQVGGFLVGLRSKGETVAELSGLLAGMLAAAAPLPVGSLAEGLVDTCGTGGDRRGTINVSTLAALTAAGAGAKVCKHGNRAASSACGSADLLEALGVALDAPPEVVVRCIADAGIGFCLAPNYHPAMRHAGPVRRELGVPTSFNFLGPLANPARVRRQIVGVSDPAMAERMIEVLRAHGSTHAMVVYGRDGLDELSTTAPSAVLELRNGAVEAYELDASELGLRPAQLGELTGGDAARNAVLGRAVLAGEAGPHRDIVVLNAAAALRVAGLQASWDDAIAAAGASLDQGDAARALERLVKISNER